MLARHMDNIAPNCYLMYTNATTYTQNRFKQFNNSYGDLLMSFCFNLMGNALQFVTKFENINLAEESQNYISKWIEVGSIFHIIFDF